MIQGKFSRECKKMIPPPSPFSECYQNPVQAEIKNTKSLPLFIFRSDMRKPVTVLFIHQVFTDIKAMSFVHSIFIPNLNFCITTLQENVILSLPRGRRGHFQMKNAFGIFRLKIPFVFPQSFGFQEFPLFYFPTFSLFFFFHLFIYFKCLLL